MQQITRSRLPVIFEMTLLRDLEKIMLMVNRSLATILLTFSVVIIGSCGALVDDTSVTNSAPVANAGPDQNVKTRSIVNLDGSDSSDAEEDSLTYSWSFVLMPAGSSATLSDPTIVNPTFKADVDGIHEISLVVNDGKVDSTEDTVTITVVYVNSKPEADAGPDQNVKTGSTVTLDGSGSIDVDEDTLTYSWTFTSRPNESTTTLSDPAIANPTFTADVDGIYEISLVVNDVKVDSAEDTVTITAKTTNSAPVANAGPDQNVKTGSIITLDGSDSSDEDRDFLTYSWALESAPEESNINLIDHTTVNPAFIADVDGSYEINLVVNDGEADSAADTVIITATAEDKNSVPVANAGPDQKVETGTTVILDSSGSSDADGDILTYNWSLISAPEGIAPNPSHSVQENPEFKPNPSIEGSYVIDLIVNDGTVDSVADHVIVTTYKTINLLNYQVIDAEYSKELDRIIMVSSVMISSNPEKKEYQLHIYDPITEEDSVVNLEKLPPQCVSVSPDGLFAAVGYEAFISYIDLKTAILVKTFPITMDVFDIVLAGNGYVYAFSEINEPIHCVNIADEKDTQSENSIDAGTSAKLHPFKNTIYGADTYITDGDISLTGLEKYSIADKIAKYIGHSLSPADIAYPKCGDLWISEDGLSIFTKCGYVFNSSANPDEDMTYKGSLSEINQIRHLDHSSSASKVILIPEPGEDETTQDTEIQIYTEEQLDKGEYFYFDKSIPLPKLVVDDNKYFTHGRFVFINKKGATCFVIIQADVSSGLLNDFGVATYLMDEIISPPE